MEGDEDIREAEEDKTAGDEDEADEEGAGEGNGEICRG